LKVIENVFIESFTLTQNDIKRRQDIDISFSGTTAVSVLVRGNQCICSNCGDSRAIIGSFTRNGWVSVALSKDHKPENAEEKERIKKSNGRVEPFKNAQGSFVGPMRVWLKNDDIPGLAMSRSIGDLVASQAGVISKPDVFVHTLRPSDKFIVIASDGIWEFISSEECVNIISTFYFSSKLSQACDHIADLAVSRWNKEDASVDDITIIIVSLSVKESIILKNV
jgi:serine/threonine protein phosphatase PrpC